VRKVGEGAVARHGGRLNVQAELVDVISDAQLWGDQYLRDGMDLPSLQQEISFQISEGLRLRLTPEEKKRLAKPSTGSSEAYEQYLRGRYYWNKFTPDGFRRAIGCFERAIALDPTYALAWAGLGDAYGTMGYYGLIPTQEAMGKAGHAAREALKLDAHLPEAHVTMALTHIFAGWSWADAEKEFRTAIRLNPRHAEAHVFYGLFSVAAGETDEGIARAVRARELDPLSAIANVGVAWACMFAHRFDTAIDALRRTLDLEPMFRQAQGALCAAHMFAGRHAEAARLLAEYGYMWGSPVPGTDVLPEVLARGGTPAFHQRLVELLEAAGGEGTFPAIGVAIGYALAGQTDEALTRLERIVEERNGQSVFLFVDPAFQRLRNEPRFTALLARLSGLRSPKA
jgi:tetratricopeptide (TPR) repeat protein